MNERTDGRTDDRMDGWMDGWMMDDATLRPFQQFVFNHI